jgi:hypothetical protein
VRTTVAVVDVFVGETAVTAQPTVGSDVLQVMSVDDGVATKFVPVTPIVSVPPAVRFPTVVTAETVGPATMAIVPLKVSRPSVNEIGTLAAAAVPGATLIVVVMLSPVESLVMGPKVTPVFVEEPVQSAGAERSVA